MIKYWAPVYIYAAIIFYISSLQFRTLPPLLSIIEVIDPRRVILHIIEYSGLGYLLYRALTNSDRQILYENALLFAVVMGLSYGITDEIHQHFVPTRELSLIDMLSNGLGSMIGAVIPHKNDKG